MKSLRIRIKLSDAGLEIQPQLGAFRVETTLAGRVKIFPRDACDEILLDIPVPETASLHRAELKHHPV